MIFIVMGVAGSGKTTVGKMLAETLGWQYVEGDDYHPAENIKKMSSGTPLNDEDRYGWLMSLRNEIEIAKKNNDNLVVTSSALKEKYRKILKKEDNDVKFIYLKGNYETIEARMKARKDHYMKAGMLKSQFDALEEPQDAIVVDASLSPSEIVNLIQMIRPLATKI